MKHFLAVTGHIIFTVLVFKAISFVLPNVIIDFFAFVCYVLLCVMISIITFGLTKRRFLNTKIKPSDKAVFITGCDSGFGYLLAKRLDSKGFHVFAGCLSPSGTGPSELQSSCSDRLHVLELDVTREESVKRAAELTKDNLGPSLKLWAVVNNAGIQKGFTVELTPCEWFKEVMDVNAFGHVRVSKAFLPLLRQSKGRIVNVTSLAGRVVHPPATPYTMSKFAAQALNECLRKELFAFGVAVISIEPQAFETSITNRDRIREHFDAMLETVEDDILADYKKKQLKRIKAVTEIFFKMVSPDVHLVIDDLESAITSEYPNSVYQTRFSMFYRMFYKIAEFMPSYVQDFTYRILEIFAVMLNATKAADYS